MVGCNKAYAMSCKLVVMRSLEELQGRWLDFDQKPRDSIADSDGTCVSSDFLCHRTSSLPLKTGAYSLMYLECFNGWQQLDLDTSLDKSTTL